MRLKVTHITVGMYHEVCFVCSAAEEAYFRTVMQALEEEHALKSCLYVYDRDPFEGAIKRRLSHCYFVLFAITPSIVKRALADENDAFRRVYGYVNRVNQSAVSLMSVGGSDYDNSAEYPKEMDSMYWLHRKQIRTGYFSPKLIAAELYAELRRHHQRRDKLYLEKQAKSGVALYRAMYNTLLPWVIWCAALVLAGTAWKLLELLLPQPAEMPWYMKALSFVLGIAGYVGIPLTAALPFRSTYERDYRLDVSTVFHDFKRLTVKRLCLYGAIVAMVAFGSFVFGLTSANGIQNAELAWTALSLYCAVLLPLAVYLVKVLVFRSKLSATVQNGAGFLQFAGWRWKVHLLFGALMAVGAAFGSQIFRFFA